MKKKIFTLLTLLVACVTGAWATVSSPYTLSWLSRVNVPATDATSVTQGEVTWTLSATALAETTLVFEKNDRGIKAQHVATFNLSTTAFSSLGAVSKVVVNIGRNSGKYNANLTMQVFVNGVQYGSDTNLSNKANTNYEFTPVTAQTGTVAVNISNTADDPLYIGSVTVYYGSAHTVTFNAGSNGLCATTSLTEASVNAGVTLPTVTPNSGYGFNGWYTASSGGELAGVAGATYYPSEDITLYAQYGLEEAASISTQPSNTSVAEGETASFTVAASGTPTPTIQWYKCDDALKTNSEAIAGATNATYSFSAPAYDSEGSNVYYYYAIASNSTSGGTNNASSNVVTLTVTSSVISTTTTINFGDAGYTAGSIYNGVTLGSSCSINNSSISCDGINFTKRVQFGGGSRTNTRFISFKVNAPCNLIIYDISNSNNNLRKFGISTGAYSTSASITELGANVGGYADAVYYEVTGKGVTTVNISNDGSTDIGIYGFKVVYNNENSYKLTIGDTGYASLSLPFAVSIPSGITAYTGTIGATSVALTEISDGVIPANTGVIITGAAGSYTFNETTSAGSAVSELGSSAGNGVDISASGDTYYVLSKQGDDAVFAKVTNSEYKVIPSNKAYVRIAAGAAPTLSIDFDDSNTTGINNIGTAIMTNDVYYNLNGQRIAQPTKGLYIVNGKKVILK